MKLYNFLCGMGGFLVLAGAARGATTPYYVSDTGSAHAQAGFPATSTINSYNTGNLVQQQVSGSTSASTSATLQLSSNFTALQLAQSSVNGTAEIGALHSFVTANSDTGLLQAPAQIQNSGDAEGFSTETVTWSDTVHFFTSNLNGSDFVMSLALDDSISAGGSFYAIDSGFYAGLAQARLLVTQDNLGIGDLPFLSIVDQYTVYSTGMIVSNPPTARALSLTFHASPNRDYFATLTGFLDTEASAKNGTGQVTVDAGNTALFALSTSDPAASYTTSSGTVFLTSVPEPACLAILASLCIAWSLPRRRDRQIPAVMQRVSN